MAQRSSPATLNGFPSRTLADDDIVTQGRKGLPSALDRVLYHHKTAGDPRLAAGPDRMHDAGDS